MNENRDLNSIKVEIAGDTYLLKSDRDPEFVASIAKYVNEKIRTFTIKSAVKSPTKIAVLAALNIAEELFEQREQHALKLRQLELFEHKSKEICDAIDSVLDNKAESV